MTAVAPVKMNVLYIGVENPVDIAVSGYNPEDISVSINNGLIKNVNGTYMVYPKTPGFATISVFAKNVKVKEAEFRVKLFPDPIAKVAGRMRGNISKTDLLKAECVTADLENVDFDVIFKVIEFEIFADIRGFQIEAKAETNNITDKQKEIIMNAPIGNKIYFSDIKAIGPDGRIRELNGIMLTITE